MDHLKTLKSVEDPFKRRLLLVGNSDKGVKKGITPTLVGGSALELYTLGGYSTLDIDLVCPDRRSVGEVLEPLGFKKFGRFWVSDELGMAVEVPDVKLAGSLERVEVYEVDGFEVYVIGKEDLIVDRTERLRFLEIGGRLQVGQGADRTVLRRRRLGVPRKEVPREGHARAVARDKEGGGGDSE